MRTAAQVAGSNDLIFSCRCGKQMFGEQIVTEHDRQLRQYEAEGEVRRREQAVVDARRRDDEERLRARRLAHAFRSSHVDEQRRSAEDLIRAREEENRRWLARLEAEDNNGRNSGAVRHGPDVSICEWASCGNPARAGSKYCSRDCSNRNARARHSSRKRGNDIAA